MSFCDIFRICWARPNAEWLMKLIGFCSELQLKVFAADIVQYYRHLCICFFLESSSNGKKGSKESCAWPEVEPSSH